jgi:HlyD family type I secretion membrane fusion protein
MPKALIAENPVKDISYNPSKVIASGLFIVFGFLGGFALWSFIAPLEGAVHAQGDINFDTKRKTVQHLEGGIVSKILVREGDTVTAGQPLIMLTDDQVRPTVDLLEGQSLAEVAAAARLEAEKNDLATILFPKAILSRAKEPEVAASIQTETKLFNAKRNAYLGEIDILKSQILQVKEESIGLGKQLEDKKNEITSISEQLATNRELLKRSYVTKTSVLELERFLAGKNGELNSITAAMARNKERLEELEFRITGLKSNRIQQSATELKQSTLRRQELDERVLPAKNSLERGVIRAPVSGKVVDLKVTTVGGVIAGREPLMDIVPSSEHLVLEARIGVNDINDVKVGLPAEVTLTAYKASTTPTVKAKVIYVSADRLTVRSAAGEAAYYAVRLEIDPQSLKSAGDLQLYPGMAAQVSITTQPRTAFDYFVGPLKDRMGRAFHEK